MSDNLYLYGENSCASVSKVVKLGASFHIEKQLYKVGKDRGSYFNSYSDIYERFSENWEDLTFFVDLCTELRGEFGYNKDSTISEIFDVIFTYDIDEMEGFSELTEDEQDTVSELTLPELEEKYPVLYPTMIELLNGLSDDDVDVCNDGATIFDCDYIDEKVNEYTYEALAYWAVYFEPDCFDAEVAQKVGLIPFEFGDLQLLALGGCGMDLSPKLDAYVALTTGHIPEDSKFFRQRDYFNYVVGSSVAQEVDSLCKRERPHYIIEFDGDDINLEDYKNV
jgi:hypothetical protein